jgi:hypothetical protein
MRVYVHTHTYIFIYILVAYACPCRSIRLLRSKGYPSLELLDRFVPLNIPSKVESLHISLQIMSHLYNRNYLLRCFQNTVPFMFLPNFLILTLCSKSIQFFKKAQCLLHVPPNCNIKNF